MKKFFSALAMVSVVAMLFLSAASVTPLNAHASKKTIKIKNTTTFNIDEIYIADPDDHKWGSDIMDPNEVLQPGEVIEIDIECGVWDVKLVAQDKSTCEIGGVNICAAAQWNITANCK